MKTLSITTCLLLLSLTACAALRPPATPPGPTLPPEQVGGPTEPTVEVTPNSDWKLVWADEFAGADGSQPDPSKWTYDTGAGGWGNNELEYYTDRPDNAYLEKGSLVIQANKESYQGQDYTSARVVSRQRGDWTYGRIEVRARLPQGQGIWPAIWMMPTDAAYGAWPDSGEIDIMELLGHQPGLVYGTLHYGSPHISQGGTYSLANGAAFSDDYHVFAFEWEPTQMRWYVDGSQYFSMDHWFTSSKGAKFPAPFDRRFYLLLNIAVGGEWPGYPDAATVLPQKMYVDYVRVYQMPWMMITSEPAPTASSGETPVETPGESTGEATVEAPAETSAASATPPVQPSLPTVEVHTTSEDQNYNLRTGPGTTYPVVRQVGGNAALDADGITEDKLWLEVLDPDGPGGKAFISTELTDYDPASGLLPVLHDLAPNPQ
jgi:beta-glucanase (GH16 family)